MTYEIFKNYFADVLARLIKVCAQTLLPVSRGERILEWAKTQAANIWTAFEARESEQDVATALYWLSVTEV